MLQSFGHPTIGASLDKAAAGFGDISTGAAPTRVKIAKKLSVRIEITCIVYFWGEDLLQLV
jgi:hypothetical protein